MEILLLEMKGGFFMSKFWNKQSTPKMAFLVLIWAAAILQLFINMGIQKEDKIIDVLSRGKTSLLEGQITTYGLFLEDELSESTKETMLKNLANGIGITSDFTIENKDNDEIQRMILKYKGAKESAVIQVISIDKKQYLSMGITLQDNLENLAAYKNVIEDTLEKLGMDTNTQIALKGTQDGLLTEEEMLEQTEEVFRLLGANKVKEVSGEDWYSFYGYGEELGEFRVEEGDKINVNVTYTLDEVNGRTIIQIGLPVVNATY